MPLPSHAEIARHEAAHAVVFHRPGHEVAAVSVGRQRIASMAINPATGRLEPCTYTLHGGCVVSTSQFTALIARVPATDAIDALTRYATGVAAGPAADRDRGLPPIGIKADLGELNRYGYFLRIRPTARLHPTVDRGTDRGRPSRPAYGRRAGMGCGRGGTGEQERPGRRPTQIDQCSRRPRRLNRASRKLTSASSAPSTDRLATAIAP